ncbi:sigma-70 family RNA polymerase sigma factor [Fodinicola feengrottensis]|uniref:SigE family RNA polymerase sigma factor n=1 Tax=Fodinicola feengrottensis TaxID=435914 RepID=A0ABP4SYD4_9ACTN|nr:sigma-70 family RNA polymerase sigma factor [Fodinicola feengrottensis]
MGAVTGQPYEACFRDLFAIAYRVGYRILGDRSQAEDVAAEACARAYARWKTVSGHSEPWVARVAGNLALDEVRRLTRWRRRESALHERDLGGDPHRAERLDLQQALQRLSKRQREVLIMRYVADMSERDVAETLGCSVGTVKSTASRAMALVRAGLTAGEEVRNDA